MAKKTHYRQLSRQAQRRRAERTSKQRERRTTVTRVAALVVAFGLATGGFLIFSGGQPEDQPTPTPSTPTASESEAPSASASPGEATGTVDPFLPLAEQTACGAEPPLEATAPKPQFSAPAQVIEENTKYFATFATSCGEIVVKLLPQTAPQTVNSFVFLAEQGYFDGQIFHRLDTSIDVVQGGDPTGTGTGGPGYSIPDELSGEDTYGPGTFAMANAGPNTGGSQFFFITGENGHLLDDNPAYTVFGQVVEGLDVLQRILQLPIQDPAGGIAGQRPVQAIYIESVTISNG